MRRILFVCVGNAGRSQMAEAFARHHAAEMKVGIDVKSGGTSPARQLDEGVARSMRERGIDVSGARPKPIDFDFARAADAIISLCGPLDKTCPAPLLPKVVDWGVEDPKGAPPDRVARIRDEIERRVVELLKALEWSEPRAAGPEPQPDTTRLAGETAPHAPSRRAIRREDVRKRPQVGE